MPDPIILGEISKLDVIQRCRHGLVPRDSRSSQSSAPSASSVSSRDSSEFSREETGRFRLFSAGWAGGGSRGSRSLPRDTRRISVLLARALAADCGGGGAGSVAVTINHRQYIIIGTLITTP